ncbi:hypothetical protein [Gordonia phthalatica]|uniref:Uncharacterized protein n=1 Tax=Gordonia phthalatica TaxID=1136941 RepID=A0A0N7FUA0_9ACTN|nr:hypothetical protein [Gordonia phthalatica]ALG83775.1 hypothetical protein ACH46_03690 [Gordonia phthalatica]
MGMSHSVPVRSTQGPPWRYDVKRWKDGATDAVIDQWRDCVLRLTEERGFIPPTPAPGPHPSNRDITVHDHRGFTVSLRVTTTPDGSDVRVELEA